MPGMNYSAPPLRACKAGSGRTGLMEFPVFILYFMPVQCVIMNLQEYKKNSHPRNFCVNTGQNPFVPLSSAFPAERPGIPETRQPEGGG
jgi:hypothetical protein